METVPREWSIRFRRIDNNFLKYHYGIDDGRVFQESFKRGLREAVEDERKAILAKQPGTQLLL